MLQGGGADGRCTSIPLHGRASRHLETQASDLQRPLGRVSSEIAKIADAPLSNGSPPASLRELSRRRGGIGYIEFGGSPQGSTQILRISPSAFDAPAFLRLNSGTESKSQSLFHFVEGHGKHMQEQAHSGRPQQISADLASAVRSSLHSLPWNPWKSNMLCAKEKASHTESSRP